PAGALPAAAPPAGAPPTGAAPAGAAPGQGRGRGGPACVNAPVPEGVTREWRTFEHVPRFHNSYVGLRNRFGLLSEAYAYATFEDRIKATNYFLEEAMTFAHQNAERLKKAVEEADKQAIGGTPQATHSQTHRGGMVDILMGEVEDE